MQTVFVVNSEGKCEAMVPVSAASEDKDLQNVLKSNFNLLPGDQINPDEPCRWMLIKREMPVPDPSTGADRWNVDFLFVDQSAVPTFVECKRYSDTRSRREVIGQVIEYAANARHYWTADDLRVHAEQTAKTDATTIEKSFAQLQSGFAGVTELLKETERCLREAEMRIVFFLEQAPDELKRSVEFLNVQMTSVDVLLVEARQFTSNGVRVVAPTLFGFTERIREIKRASAAARDRKVAAVDWESFESNAREKELDDRAIAAMRNVYDVCKELKADIAWGRGTATGSFGPKWPSIHSGGSLFAVYANGRLELHFSAFGKSEQARAFRETVAGSLQRGGFQLPDSWENGWPNFYPDDWVPKVGALITALRESVGASPCIAV